MNTKVYVVYGMFHNLSKGNGKMHMYGVFPVRQEAEDMYYRLSKMASDNDGLEIRIEETQMHVNPAKKICVKPDSKNHIPLNSERIDFPINCDLCANHAEFFCNIHCGIYCYDHVDLHGHAENTN